MVLAKATLFLPFFVAMDPGYELVCMTRLVAEPSPTYIRSAA